MSFNKHDWVKVQSLQKEGEVLEILKTGDFLVAVGGLSVRCKASDLRLVPRGKEQRRDLAQVARKLKREKELSVIPQSHTVDLHGMRVEEALKLVEARLDRAIMDNADSIRIVHGVGSGRILQAVHRYLANLPAVKSYRLDDKNPGVTWAYF